MTEDVTLPVVVHILYNAGTNPNTMPSASDIRQQLDIISRDFRQTVKIKKHEADDKEHFLDKNALWDTEKYLNIWIVNFPDSISVLCLT